MTICPNCGHQVFSRSNIVGLVLNAIGEGDSSVTYIRSQMPADLTNKEIYNALSYLTRKSIIQHVSYGMYRKSQQSTPKEA